MIDSNAFTQRLRRFFPEKPQKETERDGTQLNQKIRQLLKEKNAVLIAHYYTDPEVQKLAEETGGFIGDSLEMARFGSNHPATTLVIAGVRFMGETAKILSPEKMILMPDMSAECSLDIGCGAEEFASFKQQHPERTVVVYANTSAAVKALADWVVTSSIAVDVVRHLANKGEKIIWAPDRYLGDHIKRTTNADMLLWNAYCIVHAEFDAVKLAELKEAWPDAPVLVHPESQPEVIALADRIGSTSQLLKASQESTAKRFIVATESGILYKMQQASPDKEFIFAPTRQLVEDCNCEAQCPWMKLNSLEKICQTLLSPKNQIELPAETIEKALVPLERMLSFRK